MGLKLYSYLLVILLLLTSCEMILGKDDALSIHRESNKGNELRLDGYYYYNYEGSKITTYFLYRNGIILHTMSFNVEEQDENEKKFTQPQFIESMHNVRFLWGVYQVDNDKIVFERWYPSERPYHTSIRSGNIVNDTTFVITKIIHSDKTESNVNEVYHFKEFGPKPDSITKFID